MQDSATSPGIITKEPKDAAFRVRRYESDDKPAWDRFVKGAKNGVFLFHRDYMDYHADRFADHSLLFYEGEALVGLLPANVREDALVSHGGLTFGGVLTDDRMRAGGMLRIFEGMKAYCRGQSLSRIIYKATPHIYHSVPAEEDLYALHREGGRLHRREVAAVIRMADRVSYAKGRKWSTKRGLAQGLVVEPSLDFRAFIALEEELLHKKYGSRPTHTAAEMELLAGRFPENIKLYTASKDGTLLGGVVIYHSRRVAHTQYIGANDVGLALGAIDCIIHHLLNEVYADVAYFDFGTCTGKDGVSLNSGLMENKESYGARAVVYDIYELPTAA
jgi:Acetyltransferase (GNAT) domain